MYWLLKNICFASSNQLFNIIIKRKYHLTQLQHEKTFYNFMKNQLRQYPELQDFFDFPEFNQVQLKCLPKIMKNNSNLIVSAPTSSGKTAIFQMAILKYAHLPSPICLYLAPIKSLCHQKYQDWSRKFSKNLTVSQITGDSPETTSQQFLNSHIAVGTPEKVDFLSRQSLNFLKKIKLLLIDEIHMLNYEQRGATLQAIVSRIMSLNAKIRIIAVSATIPNIGQVGEWLRCPRQSVCVFGQEYRPVKINKEVIGFGGGGNPFTFQRMLNYKLLEAIRTYSAGRGSLIFCATQKGSESACEEIIKQMRERQFVDNDKQLLGLVQAAKQVSNNKLQTMIPQGVAFHNASLSYQDRGVVERLFLDLKIKVLCTTSTLSMGINLPARLVIIKSTQCYRGAMKGYQEYTRIEIEQMIGRAGRPPFDTEGTVLIMTQKNNFNRYNSKLQLQNLQSQLFGHMLEHINAEISLGSISSCSDLEEYFFNSFCYIRMRKSPRNYGVEGEVNAFVKDSCLKAIKTLASLNIINFNEQRKILSPRPLSISISKNAVQVRSVAKLIQQKNVLQNARQYLMALCRCQEIGKYTSKVEQRKFLKQINQRNRFVLKQSISNSQRKAFVLVQAELSKGQIDYWQMRRQAADIMVLLRRLNNCVKILGVEIKHFWLYYWATRYQKYLSLRFWQMAETEVICQLNGLQEKKKLFTSRGVNSLKDFEINMVNMSNWLQKDNMAIQAIKLELQYYKNNIRIMSIKEINSASVTLRIQSIDEFNDKYKGVNVCVGDKVNSLYFYKFLNNKCRQATVYFGKGSHQEYKIGVIKEGIIGFDQFYKYKEGKLIKFDPDFIQVRPNGNRRSLDHGRKNMDLSLKKSKSHEIQNNSSIKYNRNLSNNKSVLRQNRGNLKMTGQTYGQYQEDDNFMLNQHQKLQQMDSISYREQKKEIQEITVPKYNKRQQKKDLLKEHKTHKVNKEKQLQLPQKYRMRQPLIETEKEDGLSIKRIKKDKFMDLKKFNWKPGFEQIKSSSDGTMQESKKKKLLLVQSKNKGNDINGNNLSKNCNLMCSKVENIKNKQTYQFAELKELGKQSVERQDVFSYFYNLFQR